MADAIGGRAPRVVAIPALATSAEATVAKQPTVAEPAARAEEVVPLSGSLKDIGRNAAREAERELIQRTLEQTRWNRREAAEILGISYKALLYKIKDAELDKAS